jgi:hypothetical protein
MRKIIMVLKIIFFQNIIVEMYLIARFQCIFVQIFLNLKKNIKDVYMLKTISKMKFKLFI